VFYLLCDTMCNACPKTHHKTYLPKAGPHRGVRHMALPSPEPRPRQDERQAQTRAQESLAEGAAQLGKVSVHPSLLFGALQGRLRPSGCAPAGSRCQARAAARAVLRRESRTV